MCTIRAAVVSAMALLFSAQAFAYDVTIQIVQHDDSCAVLEEGSRIFEDAVIDALFDAGCIVSNIRAAVWDGAAVDERTFTRSLDEALSGCAEYFVMIDLFYNKEDSRSPDSALLSDIDRVSWRAVSTRDRSLVSDGERRPSAQSAARSSANGIIDFAKDVSILIENGLHR